MADLLSTAFALVVFVAAGLVVLWAISGVRRPAVMGWPLIIAVSFVLGLGLVSLQILLYSVSHIPLRVAGLSIPWFVLMVAMAGWGFWRSGTGTLSRRTPPSQGTPHGGWFVAGCGLIAAFQVVYCVAQAISRPIVGWDAWAIWFLKAKAFFVSGGLPSTHFFSTEYLHPDYPLLTPLVVTWHYLCLGRVDDQIAKIVFPLSLLALLVMFGYTLAQETRRDYAAVVTALLSLTPFVVMHAGGIDLERAWGDYVGYADLTLAVYFWGGAAFLYLYERHRDLTWALLAALFLGMGAWTKNEGLTYAAMGGVLLIVSMRSWRYALAAVGLISMFVLPWIAFKASLPLGNDIVGQARWLGLGNHLDRVPTIMAYAWRSVSGGGFGLLWFAFALGSVLNWRRMLDAPLRSCMLLIGGQLVIYVFVYMITPRDLSWHLGTSIDRVFLHVAPIALWVTGVHAYQLAEVAGKGRFPGTRHKGLGARTA